MADIAAAAVALFHAAGETAAGNAADVAPPREWTDRPSRPQGGPDSRRPPRRDDRGDRAARPRPPRPDGDFERRPARPSAHGDGHGTKPSYGAARDKRPPRQSGPPATLEGGTVVLSFSVGRANGVRPGDLVGAITGESGITSRELGAITILPRSSMVEVAGAAATHVVNAMKGASIRGEEFDVRIVKPPR
jgi:ATP-dependent RNA helicase DeaD